jgi:hypothetical protein
MQEPSGEDIRAFVERCQAVIKSAELCRSAATGSDYCPKNPSILSVTMGKKYAKIVSTIKGTNQSAAWAFVNLGNGDVLKAATWSAPAKHARGNIFDEFEGMKFIDAYGPAYLRQ